MRHAGKPYVEACDLDREYRLARFGSLCASAYRKHLDQTSHSVEEWLKFNIPGFYSKTQRLEIEAEISEGFAEAPELPEILSLHIRLKESGVQYWEGGLSDQPYYLMLELNVIETSIAKIRKAATRLAELRKPDDDVPSVS